VTPGRILITGATGFIGSRLCERLALHYQWPYRALVRHFTRAARIGRLNVDMVSGDLGDRRQLAAALEGCDSVVHLAHSDDRAAAAETRNLLAACRERGITKFVHVSSMSVHGPAPTAACTREETATISRYDDSYCNSKAEAEEIVNSAVERQGLRAVVLRPTVVYGPFSPFVMAVINEAQTGVVTLIDDGQWVCNAVYVDDVCEAICRGLESDRAVGYPSFITADEPLTWKQFITGFAGLVSPPPRFVSVSSAEIRTYWESRKPKLADNVKAAGRLAVSPELHQLLGTVPMVRAALTWAKRTGARHLSPELLLKAKQRGGRRTAAAEPAWRMPNPGRLIRETCGVAFSNDRARQILGWQPAYDFARGVEMTRTWLEFNRSGPACLSGPQSGREPSLAGAAGSAAAQSRHDGS